MTWTSFNEAVNAAAQHVRDTITTMDGAFYAGEVAWLHPAADHLVDTLESAASNDSYDGLATTVAPIQHLGAQVLGMEDFGDDARRRAIYSSTAYLADALKAVRWVIAQRG